MVNQARLEFVVRLSQETKQNELWNETSGELMKKRNIVPSLKLAFLSFLFFVFVNGLIDFFFLFEILSHAMQAVLVHLNFELLIILLPPPK